MKNFSDFTSENSKEKTVSAPVNESTFAVSKPQRFSENVRSFEEINLELQEIRFLKKMGDNIVRKLKATWTALKRGIAMLFNREVKRAPLFKEVEITIPAQVKEDILSQHDNVLLEGGLEAIKGNYNEALVCQFLFNHRGEQVNISKDYEQYNKNIAIIKKGSLDMANFLISNAVAQKATIIGAYLDNLAFQDGIDFKADIRVAIMKEGKEILDGYSLKLYGKKTVGLANTTAKALCGHLGGDKYAAKFDQKAKTDRVLIDLIQKSSDLDKIKQDHKDLLKAKTPEKQQAVRDKIKRLRGLTDAQIDKLDQTKLETARGEARKPINPRVAELVYQTIKDLEGTEQLGERILDIMGFNDKETKMLMAITTAKKSEIIAKHPDLDLSDIKIDPPAGRVTINIVGPTGKNIVTFGVKEGEKKAVSGSVSFAGLEPEDFDEYV
jgi:hypothetical protein